ncbi:OmpP1/FadL family transporter [Acinetobacter haemolyticus]
MDAVLTYTDSTQISANSSLKLNPILLGMLGIFFSGMSHASALEQSGQSILPFLEDGNYAEINLFAVDSSVTGVIKDRPDLVRENQSRDTGDIAQSTQFYTAAMKLQLTDQLSFGVLYDQPFAAKVAYPQRSNNSYFDNDFSQQGTSVKVDSQSISMIFGYSPVNNFQVYGGPVYQEIKGQVALRGNAYTEAYNGYNANFKRQGEVGWLVGGSYQIPEIALKAAVTYRSKIKYSFQVDENMLGEPLQLTAAEKTKLETPQSLNIDFQTGVAEKTLAYMNLRWVNWKKFDTSPAQFTALSKIIMEEATEGAYTKGFKLDAYQKDQYSATIGVGHQLTEKWGVATDVSWDSGTGNPASTLGPVKGSWSLSLGAQFNPAPNYFIAAGMKYYWLGDAKSEDGTYYLPIEGIKPIAEQAEFKNNHAIAYGLKIGYRF